MRCSQTCVLGQSAYQLIVLRIGTRKAVLLSGAHCQRAIRCIKTAHDRCRLEMIWPGT